MRWAVRRRLIWRLLCANRRKVRALGRSLLLVLCYQLLTLLLCKKQLMALLLLVHELLLLLLVEELLLLERLLLLSRTHLQLCLLLQDGQLCRHTKRRTPREARGARGGASKGLVNLELGRLGPRIDRAGLCEHWLRPRAGLRRTKRLVRPIGRSSRSSDARCWSRVCDGREEA